MSAGLSVLQVSPTDVGGGAEAVALQLHRELLLRGHAATLVVGRKRRLEAGVVALPQGRGVAWRAWRHLDLDRRYRLARVARALAEPGTILDLLRGHEDFRFPGAHDLLDAVPTPPDVVHVHNLHGGYFDLRALPALSSRLPLLATLHDPWLLTGHCAHPFDCERWTHGCGRCPYLRTYPALRRDGTEFNLARKRRLYDRTRLTAVTPSKWLMGMVERSVLATAASRRVVIPNGVDLTIFCPGDRLEARRSLGVSPDAKLVLFAAQGGRSNEFRDFATLERALGRLADSSTYLEVAALGDEGHGSIEVRRVPLRVVGRLEPGGVAQWLRSADVYVHPSRADTFPSGVLEALACGTPVVASRVGGIPEQIAADAGVLVEPGDDESLANELEVLLANADRRARMAAAAEVDARARFGLERQVDAYVDLYRELSGC